MPIRMTLGKRIGFSLFALILFLLLGLIVSVNLRVSKTAGSYTELANLGVASSHGDQLGLFLEKVESQARMIATRPELAEGDRERIAEILKSYSGKASREIQSLRWAGPEGAYVDSMGAAGDVSGSSYFKAVMEGNADSFISEVLVSTSVNAPIIVIAVPVRDSLQRKKGVLAAVVKVADFSSIIMDTWIGRYGYSVLTERSGVVIGDSKDPGDVMKLNLLKADADGYRGMDALGARMASGKTGSGTFREPDGGRFYLYFAPVRSSPGWSLGLAIPESETRRISNEILTFLVGFLLAGLATAILVSALLARALAYPLRRTAGEFRRFAQGEADLTVRIDLRRNDEIGALVDDFNLFVAKLREIIVRMKEAQDALARISRELGENAAQTRDAAQALSSDIRDVESQSAVQSASVSESSSAVEQIAKNIEGLDAMIVDQASQIAEASASIEELVGNIASIRASSDRMADQFESLVGAARRGKATLGSSRERIGMIAERSEGLLEANAVIAGIASQTNLLAMNAAIEAAHAGEAGKGFSVVADEIRRLAETSSEQSRAISEELKAVEAAISEVVASSGDSEEAFDQVVGEIGETDAIVRSLREALVEQEAGSTQILEALKRMNDVTSEVRHGSKEMRTGNQTILDEIGKLTASTRAIGAMVESLVRGKARIDEQSGKILAIAHRTDSNVASMEAVIGRFRV